MAFRDMLSGAVDDITGKPSGSESADFKTFEIDDFQTKSANLVQDQYVDVLVHEVAAQTAYNIGYGSANTESTVGTFFADFQDGTDQVQGLVRVITRNANDKNVDTEISGVTVSRLSNGANDPRVRFKQPEIMDTDKVGEDSKIVVQIKSTEASPADVDFSASTMELDASEY